MRKQHGIYPLISMLNIIQLPFHMVWISLINRHAFNYDINPAILTDGFFWFKDLSSPDPYGILPLLGGVVSLLNILSTSTTNMTPTMRKLRKWIYLLPCISVPIWMTFPTAFNLYWLTSSLVQLVILNLFRNMKFREFLGIPEFLPGTKLERLNVKATQKVDKPVVFTHMPSTKKKLDQTKKATTGQKPKKIK
jgi:YidC/Oxa1 family membrane protein insertase